MDRYRSVSPLLSVLRNINNTHALAKIFPEVFEMQAIEWKWSNAVE
jgi:hypothetical protein